jgi:hypothetical protein
MAMLFDEMLKYMEDNNDKQNKFIKMLCDDIHISQKTFGTKYGNMCISSRQTSQGTQRIYTVNTTPLDRVNVNTRAYDSDSGSDEEDDGEDIPQRASMSASKQRSCAPSSNLTIVPDDYEVSNDCMQDSPYLTQTAKTVMRSISYVSSSDSEKSDSEKSDSEKSDSEEEDDEMPALLPIDSDDDEMPALLPIDSDDEESNKNDLTISP